MTWNFDEPVAREGTYCVKYDLREEIFGVKNVIPMWVADMDFKTPDFVIDAMKERLNHEICGYTFRSPEYFSSIISWLKSRHEWAIEKDWICFNPGIVPALNFCTLAFTQPGDEIIVQPPVYFPFFSAVEAHNRKLVYNNLRESDGYWEMDFDSLLASITDRTRLIIISNPHNPVGRAWTREELSALSGICIKKEIVVISDEIHSDLVLPGFRHVPFASISEETASRTVTLIAPSKTFNLAGMSTSSVIISNPGLRKAFTRVTENLHITNGNIFGNIASTAAYTHGHEWLDALLRYLSGNIELVMDYCNELIPEIKPVKPDATYMIWVDCRKLGMKAKELQEFFVQKAGVGMNEGSAFGPGGEGFMRMNIATTRQNVRKALEQIESAVSALR
jgi:cystathionine beta-lyase